MFPNQKTSWGNSVTFTAFSLIWKCSNGILRDLEYTINTLVSQRFLTETLSFHCCQPHFRNGWLALRHKQALEKVKYIMYVQNPLNWFTKKTSKFDYIAHKQDVVAKAVVWLKGASWGKLKKHYLKLPKLFQLLMSVFLNTSLLNPLRINQHIGLHQIVTKLPITTLRSSPNQLPQIPQMILNQARQEK